MEKNWLIRTKSMHILGPVSREKVIELFKNGSIKPEDEVCSGNGYWIYLRENDLVERFLLGSEKQGFNPITEAPVMLGASTEPSPAPNPSEDITLFTPRPNLSAFKETETHSNSSTMAKVGDRTAEVMKGRSPAVDPIPAAKPLKREVSSSSPTPVSPGKAAPRRRSSDDPRPVTVLPARRLVSDKAFMMGALIALIALAAFFYFRKSAATEILETASNMVIPNAQAQDDGAKKKTYFPNF